MALFQQLGVGWQRVSAGLIDCRCRLCDISRVDCRQEVAELFAAGDPADGTARQCRSPSNDKEAWRTSDRRPR